MIFLPEIIYLDPEANDIILLTLALTKSALSIHRNIQNDVFKNCPAREKSKNPTASPRNFFASGGW
jgi:hypothetical protein